MHAVGIWSIYSYEEAPMLARLAEFVGRVSDKRSTSALFSVVMMVLFGLFDFLVDVVITMEGLSWLSEAAVQAAIVE